MLEFLDGSANNSVDHPAQMRKMQSSTLDNIGCLLGCAENRIDILTVPGFGQDFQQLIDRHGCNPVEIGDYVRLDQ